MGTPEDKLLEAIFRSDLDDNKADIAANRIQLKVHGGTPLHDKSLCGTCRNAHRIFGMAQSQEMVFCSATSREKMIPYPISRCSEYDDERLPSLYEMKEIAWQIVTKSNRQIGFVSAKEFKQMREKELLEGEEEHGKPR